MIRGLQSGDTARVAALYSELASGDATVGPLSEADWERFVRQPVNVQGVGFRVAEEKGRLVGLATSSLRDPGHERVRHFRILVTPSCRRRGIGSSLMQSIVALDEAEPEVVLQSLCPEEWSAARSFLEHFGLVVVETELEMRCDRAALPGLSPDPTIRIEQAADSIVHAAVVARLHNLAYRDDVSFIPYTPEKMAEVLADGAELWLLRKHEEVVGFCHLEPGSSETWIESVVVDPRCHGQGLGTRLGSVVLSRILQKPGHVARLHVSDRNPAAIRLYERLGFRRVAASRRMRAPRRSVAARLGQAAQD